MVHSEDDMLHQKKRAELFLIRNRELIVSKAEILDTMCDGRIVSDSL
jgi:hypothetical protein